MKSDLLRIEGGASLRGQVQVSGSKNAALPILAAAVLMEGTCKLSRVPAVQDVSTLLEILQALGANGNFQQNQCELKADSLHTTRCPEPLVRQMRASICLLGPLLAKYGQARLPLPGGCQIGERPIDLHLQGLKQLGASIEIENGSLVAQAKKLRGAEISLSGPNGSTVTGTANLMMAATLAEGTTTLTHAALEPEVLDLGRFLISAGANIEGLGTPRLRIQGVERLTAPTHTIIPDRIETATWMMTSALTSCEITLQQTAAVELGELISHLQAVGLKARVSQHEVSGHQTIRMERGEQGLQPCDLSSGAFPGFPTDCQAQLATLMTQANGNSRIRDAIFPKRFQHIPELQKMGANAGYSQGYARIQGPTELSGAEVTATDLRASAALVMAGLIAKGTTVISDPHHLDRGYENLTGKLQQLGAHVERIEDRKSVAVTQPVLKQ